MNQAAYFSQSTVVAGQAKTLDSFNCIRFTSVTDGVTIDFGDGAPIDVSQGDVFKAEMGFFEKAVIRADGTGAATFVHGVGSLNGGGSAIVGSGAGVVGSGSPEGAVTADPGVPYYDSSSGGYWIKATGTGTNTGWVQLIV